MTIFPITQTPLIIPGLSFWHDANDPNNNRTQPADASSVATWVDKTLSRNLTQGTVATQPTFRLNQQAGKPAIRFSSSAIANNGSSGTINLNNQSDCTFFLVLKSTSIPVSQTRVMSFYDTNYTSGRGFLLKAGSANGYIFNIGNSSGGASVANTSVSGTDTCILRCYRNGNTLGMAINGGAASEASNTNTPITDFASYAIGAFGPGGGGFWDGDLFEIMLYNRLLSAAENSVIERYLANRWGLSL